MSPKQRVINCVGQLPYKLQILDDATDTLANDEEDLNCKISRIEGNSALYSSIEYLQKQNNNYEQHVVGWTGEVTRKEITNNSSSSSSSSSNQNGNTTTTTIGEEDPLYLTNKELENLTNKIQKKFDPTQNSLIHPVWLLRRNQSRWRNYAEKVIWPTFHYILKAATEGKQENTWWYDYVKFNEAYAMEIGKIYKPNDIIWVHDYYLLLLPQLLRMKFGDSVQIAYFHHAPWPSNEYFSCLPRRKHILDGLLGANRICFQNESFSRHFVSSCKRLLDSTGKKFKNSQGTDYYNISAYGGDVVVDSLPIGINKEKLINDAFTKDINSKVLAIKQAYQDKKIIVGRDRLDTVRGVVQKLRAFETFLAMYPEWREKIVLIQVSSPTTNKNSPQTLKLEQQVNDLVNSINSQYGNLNFSPVQHYYMQIPNDVYLSLLRVADLCLVTSVRDGINTTAFEYVTIKSHESDFKCYGNPLILSEFSGSSTVLSDSIIVNPWDSVAVARSIDKALKLTDDDKNALQKKLTDEVPSIQRWTEYFLESLKQIIASQDSSNASNNKKMTPALNGPVLLENYKAAQRRLFLFDYDGTLTPIVKDPAAAIPTARLYTLLTKLSADPKNQIWIISGRDQKFLSKWLGSRLPQLGLSAEHGCFIKDVSSEDWVNLTEKTDMSWQVHVSKIMEEYTNKSPGSFIERKKVALTWHYRGVVPELGEFNASELRKELTPVADDYDLEIMDGKANIEVRPRFVNKGEIVKRLIWHKHGEAQDLLTKMDTFKLSRNDMPDFVLCLGDDFTDEDMFRQLNTIESKWEEQFPNEVNKWGHFGFYPVTVGSASKKTVAKAHLTDPQRVLDTLGLLVGNVSLFQSAGTVELDSRGHVKNSESSLKSEQATARYRMRKTNSYNNDKK